jgi:hypothetical protein
MKNKYVKFVTDDHLLHCIGNLHESYKKANLNATLESFYSNKVDAFKLTFDSRFNDTSEEKLVQSEVWRQIDKSINNAIGTFHEEILGGINGYLSEKNAGYDIRAENCTLFADIKNKHNTMNSSAAESLFLKLADLADRNKNAKCYWVQILGKNSFCEKWEANINGKEYSHSRVFKITGDLFYAKLSEDPEALFKLYQALPGAIDDYLKTATIAPKSDSSAFQEIKSRSTKNDRTILNQIAFDNYEYYEGFGTL